MRFSPSLRKAIVTLHVVTSVGWLGAEVVLLVLAAAGVTGTDPAVVYPAAGLIGVVLLGPFSVATWTVGVVSALGTPWGLLRHRWVAIKLLTTTVMTGMMLFVMVPGLRAAADLAGALPAADRRQLLVASCVATTLLVLNTALSVYKPRGRLRRTAADRPTRSGTAADRPAAQPVA